MKLSAALLRYRQMHCLTLHVPHPACMPQPAARPSSSAEFMMWSFWSSLQSSSLAVHQAKALS